jgi:hypothetical protein
MSAPVTLQVVQAKRQDALLLADLYAKAFEKTGFKEFASSEKRTELVEWIEGLCDDGKIWFRTDETGPVVLGHYEPEKDEIVTIVTRDGAERAGHATAMLNGLAYLFPSAKTRPVTRGGQALATKCGFSPSPGDQSLWMRMLRARTGA